MAKLNITYKTLNDYFYSEDFPLATFVASLLHHLRRYDPYGLHSSPKDPECRLIDAIAEHFGILPHPSEWDALSLNPEAVVGLYTRHSIYTILPVVSRTTSPYTQFTNNFRKDSFEFVSWQLYPPGH